MTVHSTSLGATIPLSEIIFRMSPTQLVAGVSLGTIREALSRPQRLWV